MIHTSEQYHKKALPLSLTRRVLRAEQRKIYDRFTRKFELRREWRVLDLGVNGSLVHPEEYFFQSHYPHLERVTGAGLESDDNFKRCFPECDYVQLKRGESLPFGDEHFDLVFCSAVVEHVGDRQAQQDFVREILRVGKRAFITTPNRWHPIEFHTVTPLLHYLPSSVYRKIYRAVGFDFFSREENLNLFDRKSLLDCVPVERCDDASIDYHYFLGFPSNLLLSVGGSRV